MMGAHFGTYIDEAGAARWRLVGGNGEKMAASEAYVSEANAERGIRDAQVAVLRTIEADLTAALDQLGRDVESMSSEDVAHYLVAAVAADKG